MARTVNPAAHARRRAEILAAAAVEFAADGVDGTSTARICRRAGIGSGTLFHYFGSKDAIFRAIFADDLPRVTELCATATAQADPDRGIDLLVDDLVEELTEPLAPGLASAAYLQGNRDPEFARIVAEIDAIRHDAFVTLIGRVRELPGRRPPFDTPATARWIGWLVDGAHLTSGETSRARTADQLRRIVDWLLGR